MHWATQYIGLKHAKGGRDRTGLDCWGLVRLVYLEQAGIELPIYPGITAANLAAIAGTISEEKSRDWYPSRFPFDGAAVGMSQQRIEHHVGIYIDCDGGKILHCWEEHNVIAEPFRRLHLKGFNTINFYQHVLWPTLSRFPILSSPPLAPASTA